MLVVAKLMNDTVSQNPMAVCSDDVKPMMSAQPHRHPHCNLKLCAQAAPLARVPVTQTSLLATSPAGTATCFLVWWLGSDVMLGDTVSRAEVSRHLLYHLPLHAQKQKLTYVHDVV